MSAPATVRLAVERSPERPSRREQDWVACEEPLEIRLRFPGRSTRCASVTMRTPGADRELAAGFLFTEGIIRTPRDIVRMERPVDSCEARGENIIEVTLASGIGFDTSRFARNFYVSSSCGICGKSSLDAIKALGVRPLGDVGPTLSGALLPRLPARLREAQPLFAATGGLHAAGLFDSEGTLLRAYEDVGRHNAVDKVIGDQVLAGRVPLHGNVLVVSGRASFEIVQKAAVAGLPFLVAVGAPSSLAVRAAREFGMTLAGFVRADSWNVYSGSERIRGVAPLVATRPRPARRAGRSG